MIFRNKITPIRQSEKSECLLACIAMIAVYHGAKIKLSQLRRWFPNANRGGALKDLIELSSNLGFRPRAVKCDLNSVSDLALPCIIHWNYNHFVILEKVSRKYKHIVDPAIGAIECTDEEFSGQFTGVAVEMYPQGLDEINRLDSEANQEESQTRQLLSSKNYRPIFTFIGLTCCLLAFSLVSPLMIQIVVDDVLVKNDQDILTTIIGVFLVSNLLSVVVTYLHNVHIQKYSSLYRTEYVYEYLYKLLRFPLTFFKNRNLGYFVAQYGSLDYLVSFVVRNFGELITDALFIVVLSMLLFYVDPTISLVILAVNTIVVIMRFMIVKRHRRYVDDDVRDRSMEEGYFVETVRGISSVKANQLDTVRVAMGMDKTIKSVNTHLKLTLFLYKYDSIVQAIKAIEIAAVVYLLAGRVLSAEMTVGLMYAFYSYRQILDQRINGFLANMSSALTLKVHKERVYEILDDREQKKDTSNIGNFMTCVGNIDIDNISYSVDGGKTKVISNYTNSVRQGDFVVVSGPTGCGKSTLLKLLINTYQVDKGTISYDSLELTTHNSSVIRNSTGVVLQEDMLFSGSILENIVCFSETVDFNRVKECAEICEIDNEINSLPMNYQSLVGDMGTNLSTGQTQRILLARALYRDPPILILDEATANINTETEERILENITRLDKTIIFASHSKSVHRHGNKIWHL